VLFIHTEGVNLTAESNGGIDEATTLGQNLMLEIQKSIFQYEGSINKMAIDDKGLVTIAVFGLPPLPQTTTHSEQSVLQKHLWRRFRNGLATT